MSRRKFTQNAVRAVGSIILIFLAMSYGQTSAKASACDDLVGEWTITSITAFRMTINRDGTGSFHTSVGSFTWKCGRNSFVFTDSFGIVTPMAISRDRMRMIGAGTMGEKLTAVRNSPRVAQERSQPKKTSSPADRRIAEKQETKPRSAGGSTAPSYPEARGEGPIKLGFHCPASGEKFDFNQAGLSRSRIQTVALASPSGTIGNIYGLDQALPFNVLDAVVFNPNKEQITLSGHYDPRFAGPKIPYLQHLAVLLEYPRAEMTLNWLPDSEKKVDAFFSRIDEPDAFQRLGNELGAIWDGHGGVKRSAEWQLHYLGIEPGANGYRGLDRVDLNAAMLAKGGDVQAACLVLALRGMARSANASRDVRQEAFHALFAALGNGDQAQALFVRRTNGSLSAAQYEYQMNQLICEQMDNVLHLKGAPLTRSFFESARRGRNLSSCAGEYNSHLREVSERAIDLAWKQHKEIVVPVEGIASLMGARPEVRPIFKNIDQHSSLARTMLEADYLGKQLINLPDYESSGIAGYQSEFSFNRNNPAKRVGRNATQHLWFSINSVDAGQSSDGKILEIHSAKVAINIREYDVKGNDLPRISGGYGDLLTSLYPQFESRYPVLHELEEVAKLSEAASWLRQKQPDLRLPRQGRQTWSAPESLPGIIYMTTSLVERKDVANTVFSAMGGVSLVIPYDAGGHVRDIGPQVGTSFVDLRNLKIPETDADISALNLLYDGKAKLAIPGPFGQVHHEQNGSKQTGSVTIQVAKRQGGDQEVTAVTNDIGTPTLWDTADLKAAESALKKVDDKGDPYISAATKVKLAIIEKHLGRVDAAVTYLEQARHASNEADLFLAEICERFGDEQCEREALKRYITIVPSNTVATKILLDLNNRSTARVGLQSFSSSNPGGLFASAEAGDTRCARGVDFDRCKGVLNTPKFVKAVVPPAIEFSRVLLDKVQWLQKNKPEAAELVGAFYSALGAQSTALGELNKLSQNGGAPDPSALENLKSKLNDAQKRLKETADELEKFSAPDFTAQPQDQNSPPIAADGKP